MASKSDLKTVFSKIQLKKERFEMTSIKSRKYALKSILKWLIANDERIKKAIYDDFKKPPSETDVTEIYPVVSEIRHALNHLSAWANPLKVDTPLSMLGSTSYVKYEPKGVCLIIAPWNYPFNLAIGPLVSCIAAGNVAIIKPSEMTPNTASLIQAMITEIFPEKEVVVVNGGVDVSKELLTLPFDHIFFTGSPNVGKIVMRAASDNLTSVTLELGGKSPAIVDNEGDLVNAAEKIAWGKFLNNGQTCIAPDYLLVHEDVASEFSKILVKQIDKLFGSSNNFSESKSYGRIVNKHHYDRLNRLLEKAITDGAEIAMGGNTIEDENFIPPTVLTNVPMSSDIMQEEIFGPLLPIITYHSLKEAIDTINSKPKALALYYFGTNKKNREEVLSKTTSGNAVINDCVIHFGHVNLPFGGVNNSGIGKSHGKHGFLAFSNEKGVMKQRTGLTSTKFIYPPYTDSKKAIISFLKKYL